MHRTRKCYRSCAVPNPSLATQSGLAGSPAASTLQARKQQLVREAIWDAAVTLFSEKGFDETTVDDIAQASGVSRRSFFRYFSSKNDLMAHGIVNYGTSLTDAIRACPRTYSPSQLFRETVLAVAKQSAPAARTRKIMRIAAKYPAAREAQLTKLAEVQEQLAEVFAERLASSGPGDPRPHLMAGLTLTTLSATFRMWFHGDGGDVSVAAGKVLEQLGQLLCDAQNARTNPERRAESRKRRRA
jgi:AcrR family transcriptional regulator